MPGKKFFCRDLAIARCYQLRPMKNRDFGNRNFLALWKSETCSLDCQKNVNAICKCITCYQQTGSIELMSKYKHFRKKVVHVVKREYLGNLKSASCKNFESVEY